MADYLMINMLHSLLSKTLDQMNDVFERHIIFMPSREDILELKDLSVTLEKPRPVEAPQVRN